MAKFHVEYERTDYEVVATRYAVKVDVEAENLDEAMKKVVSNEVYYSEELQQIEQNVESTQSIGCPRWIEVDGEEVACVDANRAEVDIDFYGDDRNLVDWSEYTFMYEKDRPEVK